MDAFGKILVKKPGFKCFLCEYNCHSGIWIKVKVFARSQLGAIGMTYPLAVSIGFDNNLKDTDSITEIQEDTISGHSVETNLFIKLKNSRKYNADEKRNMIKTFMGYMNDVFFLPKDEFTKYGRIIC
jgi:hypothetical protein